MRNIMLHPFSSESKALQPAKEGERRRALGPELQPSRPHGPPKNSRPNLLVTKTSILMPCNDLTQSPTLIATPHLVNNGLRRRFATSTTCCSSTRMAMISSSFQSILSSASRSVATGPHCPCPGRSNAQLRIHPRPSPLQPARRHALAPCKTSIRAPI